MTESMTKTLLAALLLGLFVNCGGSSPVMSGGNGGGLIQIGGTGGATTADPNVIAVVVDQGPQNIGYTNGLFASVTLCEPGTTTCQTIDHVLVDTGSVGLRVLESELTLSLPVAQDAAGLALAECTPFVDGTSWGPIKRADIQLGGETALDLPIQVIGEASYPMATSCTGTPITDFKSLAANGILGVGVYLRDCGDGCATAAGSLRNPGLYYTCTSAQPGGCKVAAVPVAQQVPNPVAAFPVDNNGVIIELPGVPASGAPSVPGLLVFGIGTQENNSLGAATVLPLDSSGFVETAFPAGGTQYTSYLDSGSNGMFFLNSQTSGLPICAGQTSSFYCPTSTKSLTATVVGAGDVRANVSFSVANASKLPAGAFAFSNLAGPMPGFPSDKSVPGFDWGLSFYFGRKVFTGIETAAGSAPYFAF
jgi:hypothetical protein